MRIERVEMEGFRSYARATAFDLGPGLNIVCGPNEAGKTGLLLAIQAALFPPSRAHDRARLVTEGSTTSSVTVQYALRDGSRHRVERDLLQWKHRLLTWTGDERDGSWSEATTQITDVAAAVREHTGCDENLWRSTSFVGHESVEVPGTSDMTNSLGARLETLLGGGGRIPAVRAAVKLEESLKKLTGPHRGEIVEGERLVQAAEVEAEAARVAASRMAAVRDSLAAAGTELEALAAETEAGAAALQVVREGLALERRLEETRAEREMIDRTLDTLATLDQLDAEFAALGPPPIVATAPPPRLPLPPPPSPLPVQGGSPRPGMGRLAAIGAGTLLGVLGAVLFLLDPWPDLRLLSFALLAAGVGLAASAWLTRPRVGAPLAGTDGREAPGTSAEDHDRSDMAVAVAAAVAADTAKRNHLDRQRHQAMGRLEALDHRSRDELAPARAALGRDIDELIERIRLIEATRPDPAGFARLERREKELPSLTAQANRRHGRLEQELRDLELVAGGLAEREDEVAGRRARVERLKFRAEALRLAHEELTGAIEEVRSGFGPAIVRTASELLREVAPGFTVGLADEKELQFVPRTADGAAMDRQVLSDGTADQFHFAVRVALADVLLGEIGPPLLLDDPFRYCDDHRRKVLHSMLETIADRRQVIYLTVASPEHLPVTHHLPLDRLPLGRLPLDGLPA